jgi:hypothetical protein
MLPAYARLRVEPEPSLFADLNQASAGVAAAVARHAVAATAEDAASDAVVTALNELRARAVAYARLLQEATGWGNPFDALEDGEETEDAEDEPGPEVRGVRLTLMADLEVDGSGDDDLQRIEDLMHRDWPPAQWAADGVAVTYEEWGVSSI